MDSQKVSFNFNNQSVFKRVGIVLFTITAVFIAFLGLFAFMQPNNVLAAPPFAVEILGAYNYVVDSNVESPSTYAPSVATVAGEFCNTGTTALTDVQGYIGDATAGTPGLYPVRDSADAGFIAEHPHLANTGDYALTHVGGAAGLNDASRYIGTLQPGECKVQYWHHTYPQISNDVAGNPQFPYDPDGVAVWGATNDPNDDLWLDYDIWMTSNEDPMASATKRVTMRNEISAMANKIQPNGGSWFNTNTSVIRPGDVITSNGVLYELGNINKGFDNDGDGNFDYNAWLQPVGDPSYDPSCFRLIRTSGFITVSRSGGNPDLVIPFSDQLYFTDLPQDNTGVVGNVYYTFMALNGPCSTGLTPYQEVASGADNEKFNGDYGAGIPPVASSEPEVSISKNANPVAVDPTDSGNNTITYTLDFANSGAGAAGLPLVSMPLVLRDSIPVSTTYVSGSAEATFSHTGNGATILYSTDNGATWSATEPIPASNVTDIQWWLNDALPAGESGSAAFSVQVDAAYNPPSASSTYVENTGEVGFGDALPFAEDDAITMILGSNEIGDLVWQDDDGSGLQNGSEAGIGGVTVNLYIDVNGDGLLDAGDLFVESAATAVDGSYLFDELPNGDFLVEVDTTTPQIPTGYSATTNTLFGVTLASNNDYTADFGFGPSLALSKSLLSGQANEGELLTYRINLTNLRPGNGTGGTASCQYTVWSTIDHPTTGIVPVGGGPSNAQWANTSNALGLVDGLFTTTNMNDNADVLGLSGFNMAPQTGNITSVEAVLYLRENSEFKGTDQLHVRTYIADVEQVEHSYSGAAYFTSPAGTYYILNIDVTTDHPTAWAWSDFSNNTAELQLEADPGGGAGSSGDIALDGVAYVITTDQTCDYGNATLNPVPLTDTYDADRMEFVSSTPSASSVTTGGSSPYANTGTITWSNAGPIYAGQTTSVEVTFRGLEPPDNDADGENDSATITNTASVTGATFVTGEPANDAQDDAVATINPTGTIGDIVWNDMDGDGVQDASEPGIPNVAVELYDGSGDLVATAVTDASGNYLFEGLLDDDYTIVVDPSTLPGTSFTQTGDPETPGSICPSNGPNACDDEGDTTLNNNDGASTNDDDLGMDFGYQQTLNTVFGNVWQDNNGDSMQDAGENGLTAITVELQDGICTPSVDCLTTTTDANGNYLFTDVPNGTYSVVVTPPAGSWSQTVDPDATIDNMTTTPLNLTGGMISGSHDFAYTETGLSDIGDTIYADWNGDGTQDSPGEEGFAGVTVTLYEDANGDGLIDTVTDAVIGTATTTATGFYEFTNLPAGDYIVVVDEDNLPYAAGGFQQTEDPDATADSQTVVTLDGTTDNFTLDFGYQPVGTVSIGDLVWQDNDRDGIYDAGESGIENILVTLYEDQNGDGLIDPEDAVIATALTAVDGSYLFDNLPAGDYIVDVDTTDTDLPTDGYGNPYVLSTSNDPLSVTLSSGESYEEADFGFSVGSIIGDLIWRDDNRNGNYENTIESGIAGVDVNLYQDVDNDGLFSTSDILVDTATTDANGLYLFTSLPADNYVVTVITTTLPANVDTVPTGDPDESIPCTVCDAQTGQTLSPGQTFMGADFGFPVAGVIGDAVWVDLNDDGIYDQNETGLANVTVTITNSLGVAITTTTDADGYYLFAGLTDDTYTVTVNLADIPAGYTLSYDLDGTLDGETAVTITGGNINLTADFGFTPPGDIIGHIFEDTNGNGVQDAGEPNLANVDVSITDSLGHTQTVTTDIDGNWIATVPEGSTTADVDETTLPAGYVQTAGTDPTTLNVPGGGTGDAGDDGYQPQGTVSGHLYIDTNGNGTQDAGEPDLANVDLEITDSNGITQTVTTDANGDWTATVPPGSTTADVDETDPDYPTGYAQTEGTDPTTVTAVAGSDTDAGNDGYYQAAIVSGHLYIDTNGNGTQDAGEPDLADVDVIVTSSTGVTQTVTTDANGDWMAIVPPGSTIADVDETDPEYPTGYTQTEGTDPTTVTAVAGTDTSAGNDGYYQAGTVSGHLYLDSNGNGTQDVGEPDLADVDLTITNSLGVTQTVTTDANGDWSATVPPGSTTADVDETDPDYPTGYTQTEGTDPTTVTAVAGTDTSAGNDGYYQSGTVSGHLYIDTNGNGTQDAGEPDLANVDLEITDSNGITQTVTTDANGDWTATVPPGSTTADVDETDPEYPTGYTQTEGTDPTTVTAVAGTDTSAGNDGYYLPGTVSGHLYIDTNGNGTQDAGEPDLQNVDVVITDSNGITQTVTTDANGDWTATVPPGSTTADVDETDAEYPTGYTQTEGTDPTTVTAVAGTDTSAGNDGYTPPTGTVSGHLYLDTNGNGIQDVGEPDLANVDIIITDSGGITQTVTTDANGDWTATVPPGSTTADVDETDAEYPAGYTQTEGTDPTTVTAVAGSDTDAGNDGYYQSGTVSGHLYIDTNGNGTQDVGEPDLANVDLEITDSNGITQTVTTDANGDWTATVPPGSTTADVDESDTDYPTGYTQTEGTDPTTVTAVAGTDTSAGNDGYYQAGTVFGHLYIDTNGNGTQDAGEPNLANVDLLITDSNGITQTVTTNADGNWTATVPPGTITADVDETDPDYPTGYTQTEGTDPTTVTAVAGSDTPAGIDGYYLPGTVSGHLYLDSNGNGIQDAGEPDLTNVDIIITDSGGITQTVTTDANGDWMAIVPPGSTTADVDETDPQYPTGYTQTEGTDPTTVTAVAGTDTSAGNDGYYLPGTVSGHLYLDSNGNGIQDAGEPNLTNVDVVITNSNGITQTVTTDANGDWTATVPPGSTTADIDETDPDYPTGSTQTEGTDPTIVTAVAGTNTPTDIDGFYLPASIGDLVWHDSNSNGIQDGGEPGLQNVTVNLYDGTGAFATSDTTNASGIYAFTNLIPGDYYLEFVLPSGYAFTYADNSASDLNDSDANPATGQTAVTTLTAGENDPTWDAGLYQTVRLGNRVWFDTNNNGVLDGSEQGIPNIQMELLDGTGNPVVSPVTGLPITTTTDATGRYVFDSIPPGTYIVRVAEENFDDWTDPLYGFVSSLNELPTDPAADPDGNDSDVDDNGRNNPDPANGGIVSYPVTLAVGDEPTNEGQDEDGSYANADSNLTVDFGFFELLTLGNFIWLDNNENSQIDSGEPGVSGVVVYLLDGNGDPVLHPVTNQPINTTTNSSGFYQFTNLYPGEYRVLVSAENFQIGGALEGYWSSPGAVDPDNNSDFDDNGVDQEEPWLTGIASESVQLDYDLEPDNNADTDDNDNTNLTVDMGFVGTPTAVTLTSFTATNLGNQQVRISWTTESEVDNFGFRIYRSSSNSFGSATEVHFEPTAVPGGTGPGANYSYVDDVPDNGTYYYWLVDVETDGDTAVHGPISVAVTPFFNLYLPLVIGGN
ncbi:SdrD B-like domain-containing protein [Candidatus Leptofilum sp.]|uniref:SdrD B-like domain-containing protein n=1 Tax=Candidatus Leptofilum sp. TaxID=3241576 RepID=UPI003B5AEF74